MFIGCIRNIQGGYNMAIELIKETFKVEELAFGQKQRVCPCPRVRQELDRNHKDLNVED